jgi:hypothetical protein
MNVEQVPLDIIFDSTIATNGDRDNPRFQMNPPLENVVGYSVMWSNIPFSYFTIDNMNNTFEVILGFGNPMAGYVDDPSAANPHTIVIKPGTYDGQSFCDELARAFAQSSLPNGIRFGAFLEKGSARLVIYSRANTLQPEAVGDLTWPSNYQPYGIKIDNELLAKIMGFEPGATYRAYWRAQWQDGKQILHDTADYSNSERRIYALTAPYQVNLPFASVMEVHSNLASYGEVRTDQGRPDNKLIKVPLTSNFGSYINYSTMQPTIPIRRTSIDQVTFYLTLPGRDVYGKNSRPIKIKDEDQEWPNNDTSTPEYVPVQYLPLNGQGFQVCIRFIVDNGVRPTM